MDWSPWKELTAASREASWAETALKIKDERDLLVLSRLLISTLSAMEATALTPEDCRDHSAVRLIVAAMAEAACLDFHWPTVAEMTCQQAIAAARVEATLRPLSNG